MPAIIRGSELELRVKTAAGVEAATGGTGWQALNFYSENFQPGEGLVDDEELGGTRHNLVDPTLPARALPNPTGQITVPMDRNQLPFWLSSMWGVQTTSGTSPNFTHVWNSGGLDPRLLHIEMPLRSTWVRMADSQVVKDMSFDLADIDGFRKVDLTMLGRSVRSLATAVSSSPTAAPARDKISGAKGVLKINGTQLGNVLGGRFMMSNGATIDRYLDDSEYPGAVEIGRPSVEMSPQLRIRQDSKAVIDIFDGVTPFTAQLLFQLSANTLLQIDMPQMIAPPVLPASGGVGAMDVTINARGAQKVTSTAAPMVTVTIKNQVATYA